MSNIKNKKRVLTRLGVLIFIVLTSTFLITLILTELQIEDKTPMVEEQIPNNVLAYKIDDVQYYLDMNAMDTTITPVSLTTERNVIFDFTEVNGYDIKIDGELINTNELYELKIDKLSQENWIQIAVSEKGKNIYKNFGMVTIPGDLPILNMNGKSNDKGCYYFTAKQYIIKMNQDGEIVYYKSTNNDSLQPYNFRQVRIQDKIYYTYMLPYTEKEMQMRKLLKDTYYVPSKAIIMNEKYEVIDEIEETVANSNTIESVPLDAHDFIMLGEKHYIVIGYYGERVNNIPDTLKHSAYGTNIISPLIQEIKNGKVIWQWKASDYPDLYEVSVEGNDYNHEELMWADYLHINSIVVDPVDSNLICSFRNADMIVKIDKSDGNILWILGGKQDQFGLSEEQKFSRQHTAFLTDEHTITIFDNGNKKSIMGYPIEESKGDYSNEVTRIIEIKLDEKDKKTISYEAYKIDSRFSPSMGSAQKIGDSTFVIGWGQQSKKTMPLFTEVDFSSHEIIAEVYSYDEIFNYRVFKADN